MSLALVNLIARANVATPHIIILARYCMAGYGGVW